jgi:hypothetical protein
MYRAIRSYSTLHKEVAGETVWSRKCDIFIDSPCLAYNDDFTIIFKVDDCVSVLNLYRDLLYIYT